jgi:Family of unknown function (DUF5681)
MGRFKAFAAARSLSGRPVSDAQTETSRCVKIRLRAGPRAVRSQPRGGLDDVSMSWKAKTPPGNYAIGKGRPPKASRWTKGQSGNPKGKVRQSPSDSEFIERLFRRRFPVTERGRKVLKTGFAIIHSQLLTKESSGQRRAGRTRDRYEAFARVHEGMGAVQLRYVDSGPAPVLASRPKPGGGDERRPAGVAGPIHAQTAGGREASVTNEPGEGKP